MMPDDNAPTIPNRPALSPGQPDAPGNLPPASRAGGNQPVWQVPRASGPGNAKGANLGGFGLGFGIALVVLAAMALVLVVALTVNGKTGALGAVPTATATATPTQSPPQPTSTPLAAITKDIATGFVTQFYTDINSKSYQNAYNLLGSNLQASQNYGQFKQQWQDTQSSVDTADITVTPVGDGSGDVTVVVSYSLTQSNNGTITSSQNQATLTVGYEQGSLHILALNVTSVQATPTPIATATPTPTPVPTDTPTPAASPTDTPTATSTPILGGIPGP